MDEHEILFLLGEEKLFFFFCCFLFLLEKEKRKKEWKKKRVEQIKRRAQSLFVEWENGKISPRRKNLNLWIIGDSLGLWGFSRRWTCIITSNWNVLNLTVLLYLYSISEEEEEEEGEDFNGRHRGCEGRWGRNRGGAISKQPQPHTRALIFLNSYFISGKSKYRKKNSRPFLEERKKEKNNTRRQECIYISYNERNVKTRKRPENTTACVL